MAGKIRDIFAIPEDERRYVPGKMELNNELDEIIQQVDLLLFTRPGSVLGYPNFGCDLEKFLFETDYNAEQIKTYIDMQIFQYVRKEGYQITVSVDFVKWEFNVAMIVDLKINGKTVSSYLV